MFSSLKRRMHASLSPLLYGPGLALVPARANRVWPQRAFMRRHLRSLEVDCIFDVGANVGQYGKELRQIGYRHLIISFEPDWDAFRQLEIASRGDRKWKIFNFALGREVGEATLNIMAVSLFNSFRDPSVAESSSFEHANTVVEERRVLIDTLANMFARVQDDFGFRTAFLKMDTQGFDLEVFAGSAPIHDRLVGLQTELSLKRIYQGTPTWVAAIEEYRAAGFELAGLFPVNPGDKELIEFDCVLQNRRMK